MADSTFLQRELRRRMKSNALSARALSLKAHLNETAVKAILSGKSRNPRSDTLTALAGVLGCTVNDLLGPANGGESTASLERERMIGTLRGLLESVEGSPPPVRKRGIR